MTLDQEPSTTEMVLCSLLLCNVMCVCSFVQVLKSQD
jgi:hypothetical protein